MKIFISCSSSNNINEKYSKYSLEIIKDLSNNILVFGGYDSGIMGLAYNEFKNSIGVASNIFKDDLLKLNCEKIVVDNSGQATFELINNCDVMLVLPGGIGTLMELFTAIHMKKISELTKPIIIYNIDGFYNNLIKIIEDMQSNNFIDGNLNELLKISDSKIEVIEYIKSQTV